MEHTCFVTALFDASQTATQARLLQQGSDGVSVQNCVGNEAKVWSQWTGSVAASLQGSLKNDAQSFVLKAAAENELNGFLAGYRMHWSNGNQVWSYDVSQGRVTVSEANKIEGWLDLSRPGGPWQSLQEAGMKLSAYHPYAGYTEYKIDSMQTSKAGSIVTKLVGMGCDSQIPKLAQQMAAGTVTFSRATLSEMTGYVAYLGQHGATNGKMQAAQAELRQFQTEQQQATQSADALLSAAKNQVAQNDASEMSQDATLGSNVISTLNQLASVTIQ